jgi:hypothetical protein
MNQKSPEDRVVYHEQAHHPFNRAGQVKGPKPASTLRGAATTMTPRISKFEVGDQARANPATDCRRASSPKKEKTARRISK